MAATSQVETLRMCCINKSPSRLRRDAYRMSIYNSCKQTLEIEQKSEDLLVLEDQVSLMNETMFKNFDTIDRLKNELDAFKKHSAKKRGNLSFRNVVNLDIPPHHHTNESRADVGSSPWPWS